MGTASAVNQAPTKSWSRKPTNHYVGNPRLKGSNVKMDFTADQLQEYFHCSQDPIYFIRKYVKIVNVDKGVMPFDLWDFQEKMVNTFHNNRFSICKILRQVGKSTTVCAYFLWLILFQENQVVAILANKGDLARILLGKIKYAYEFLPFWLQQGVLSWNQGSIELENGSKIIATSTTSASARGNSYNAILLDEFAFVHRNMQEQFFSSVYPTISSGETTKVIIVSTPNGIGDLFHKMWVNATNKRSGYIPLEVNWWDMPGRDEAWKQATIANTSLRQFQQEFETEFLGSSNTLIDPNYIRRMVYQPPVSSKDSMEIIESPIADHIYCIACDTSRGIGLDASAFITLDITQQPYKTVAKYRNNEVSPLLYPNVIWNAAKIYNEAYVLVEINDNGQQVADILHDDLEYSNLVHVSVDAKKGQRIGQGFGHTGQSLRRGVKTSKQVKRLGCTILKNLIEGNKLTVTDFDTIGELATFVLDKDTYAAEEGCNDDLAMSLVLFAWMVNQDYFKQITDKDLRLSLYQDQMKQMEDALTPFGIIDTGINQVDIKVGIGEDSWLVTPEELENLKDLMG